jgi:hypothetical protein
VKRLFGLDDRYSARGSELGRQIDRLVTPIVKALSLEGYSMRDVELIVCRAVQDTCVHFLITKQMKGEG